MHGCRNISKDCTASIFCWSTEICTGTVVYCVLTIKLYPRFERRNVSSNHNEYTAKIKKKGKCRQLYLIKETELCHSYTVIIVLMPSAEYYRVTFPSYE